MAFDDIQPFLGRDCSVVVRCRACGHEHARSGRLLAGPARGDLMLAGSAYNPDDVVSISAAAENARLSFDLRILLYLGGFATLAAWLHAVRW